MITNWEKWINYHWRKPQPLQRVVIMWKHAGDHHFKHFECFDAADLGFLEEVEIVFWTVSPI
ncbi:hypothetical protein PSAR109036_01920 [Psychrobacter arenosus]